MFLEKGDILKTVFNEIYLSASGGCADKALEILKDELEHRFGFTKIKEGFSLENSITFQTDVGNGEDESFIIKQKGSAVTVTAHRFRGLIYGIGYILRKCETVDGSLVLGKNISGEYTPALKIRGHGIGYTDMSNTYEAWDRETLRRYILDLMFFGLNTVETSFAGGEKRTRLMKYSFPEAMKIVSECCLELDADLMIWYALSKNKTADETVAELETLFADAPKVNSLFLPGGDPGDMQAEDFITKCIQIKNKLKRIYPDVQLWPSAQAPHEFPDWGEHFRNVMKEKPEEINGVIYGPNHAMSLPELRKCVGSSCPVLQFPDICHNVRCESPVHYYDDDWHFAYAAALGRESVNPRPLELKRLHGETCGFVDGNCSYSEGVNDDVNKVVWSALDFNPGEDVREILCDYSRLFFPGVNPGKGADAILALEQSWYGDPAENCMPDYALSCIESLQKENNMLEGNWRYRLLLFRAKCDKLVRDRRLFELSAIQSACEEIRSGSLEKAEKILSADFTETYNRLRKSLSDDARTLHNLIGIQLDTEHFGGMNYERGCVLDTVDMPVTDREFLLNKVKKLHDREALIRIIDRNKTGPDEYYFSFALHGFAVCGRQEGEYYIDFCGDGNSAAEIPVCLTKGYDHFSFSTEIAGLTGGDYLLKITYKYTSETESGNLTVRANGNIIYSGVMPGGLRDREYESTFLPEGYICRVYEIKKEFIDNGCLLLEMNENTTGFVIPEFRIVKK